jgi:hypothetical protein
MRRFSNIFNTMSLKLSLTGDTAKYLVLTLYRGGALFPQDLVIPFSHEAHFTSNGQVETKTRSFRNNPPNQPGRAPTYHLLPPSVHLVEFLQLSWSRQSPFDLWLHWKLHDLSVSNLFALGWPSTSEIHLVVQRFDDMTPGNHST